MYSRGYDPSLPHRTAKFSDLNSVTAGTVARDA